MQRYHTIRSELGPPAWAYRNRTDSHHAPCHSASPRGLLQTAQEFRDRDPTRSTAGRRIPTILALALSLSPPGIPVFHVWLHCPPPRPTRPPQCFDIVLARGGRGHARQRRASLTGNELQTVIIIKLKIYTALESGGINRADEEGLCY